MATWDEFNTAVKVHFQQPVNKAHARLDLSQRRQGTHESANKFLSALRELTPDCQYTAAQLKEVLTLQILAGCCSEDMQMHMLWANMNLDIIQSEECTTSDSAAIYTAACSHPGASVSVTQRRPGGRDKQAKPQTHIAQSGKNNQGQASWGCGQTDHAAKTSNCPHQNDVCRFCNNKGHSKRCCLTKQ